MPTFMIQKGVLGRWRWFTIVIGLIAMVSACESRRMGLTVRPVTTNVREGLSQSGPKVMVHYMAWFEADSVGENWGGTGP